MRKQFFSETLVLTVGTFLNGNHTGNQQTKGGRKGDAPSIARQSNF